MADQEDTRPSVNMSAMIGGTHLCRHGVMAVACGICPVERERDEMIAAYDNCMKLALTYHGQLERTRAALRDLIDNEFAYLQPRITSKPTRHTGVQPA